MFRKYPEVENTYNTKFIDKFTYLYPKLLRIYYVVYEKLHGANLQIIIPKEGDIQIGRKNDILKHGESFYDIWKVLPRYKKAIDLLVQYVKARDFSYMTFYCEYFGGDGIKESRIQKGVIYNPLQQLRFFGIATEGELEPPTILEDIFEFLGIKELLAPKIGVIEGLEPALHIDIEMSSLINPIEGNIMEGVVIQPYSEVFTDKTGKCFLLKKKNEKFQERQKERKPRPVVDELDEKIISRLHEIFLGYLNENRLQNTFSKIGEIEDKSEMSKYIEFTIKDAIKDFEKDFGEEMNEAGYGRLEKKRIYKGARVIVEMLKNYL